MTDSDIHAKIQANDGKVFETVFTKHYDELCRSAFGYVRDSDEAEEVVQEIFVKYWNNRTQISISTSIKSFLYQSVKNNCLNKIKHLKIVREHENYQTGQESRQETPSDKLLENELQEKIDEVISQLPQERKKVFLMSRNDGLRYKEIADKLGIAIKTVENQMGKALKFLRIELAEFLVLSCVVFLETIKNLWE